jgi:hypothetical protein
MTAEPLCVIRGTAPISELLKMNPASRKCPPRTASFSRQSINIGIDMPGGLPYQPWLAKLVEERTANQAIHTSDAFPMCSYAHMDSRTM